MFTKKKLLQTNCNRGATTAANRRKRMRSNNLKKILCRQRRFAIREFADFEGYY